MVLDNSWIKHHGFRLQLDHTSLFYYNLQLAQSSGFYEAAGSGTMVLGYSWLRHHGSRHHMLTGDPMAISCWHLFSRKLAHILTHSNHKPIISTVIDVDCHSWSCWVVELMINFSFQ